MDVSDHDTADGITLWTRLESIIMSEQTTYSIQETLQLTFSFCTSSNTVNNLIIWYKNHSSNGSNTAKSKMLMEP